MKEQQYVEFLVSIDRDGDISFEFANEADRALWAKRAPASWVGSPHRGIDVPPNLTEFYGALTSLIEAEFDRRAGR